MTHLARDAAPRQQPRWAWLFLSSPCFPADWRERPAGVPPSSLFTLLVLVTTRRKAAPNPNFLAELPRFSPRTKTFNVRSAPFSSSSDPFDQVHGFLIAEQLCPGAAGSRMKRSRECSIFWLAEITAALRAGDFLCSDASASASSIKPTMAGHFFQRGFSWKVAKTRSSRSACDSVSCRWCCSAVLQVRAGRRFDHFGQRLGEAVLRIVKCPPVRRGTVLSACS